MTETYFEVSPGMPLSVFTDKYSRVKDTGEYQSWSERVTEVVDGNYSLLVDLFEWHDIDFKKRAYEDRDKTVELACKGILPFSGRHLQHGDKNQRTKKGETFTNCSTAMLSFIEFYLLLKGSGVGRCYDADLCRVNWDNMPNLRLVLSESHPDYEPWIEPYESAKVKYDSECEQVRWFKVEDSAEGWVKVVEVLETAAFQEKHREKLFIFDLSAVRCKGTPIKGQQNRPASGPVPFILSLLMIESLRGAGMKPWKQAMYVDHYLAACVGMGGVRRSARIACRSWTEKDILEFIDIKRVLSKSPWAYMYSANNSVLVDEEFWDQAESPAPSHGRRVFEAMTSSAYFDKTGEPGCINVDKFTWNKEGLGEIDSNNYFSPEASEALKIHSRTLDLVQVLLDHLSLKKYQCIPNPCGEIVLWMGGAYCVIGDICLANVRDPQDAVDGSRCMAQFLVRANTMPFLYQKEVERTNRIGVSLTGIHEYALEHYRYDFYDLLDDKKSSDFWSFISLLSLTVENSANEYSDLLGRPHPHTHCCEKPSGTISKVMDCTEAAHLPSTLWYLRWVQYPIGSEVVKNFEKNGYPVKDVSSSYPGHVIVGFPTKLPITDKGDVVTASEPTPEQHYQWIRNLEKYWLGEGKNNQISYTLKYNPEVIDYLTFRETILKQQSTVRACSIMPHADVSAYAYLPEQSLTESEYLSLMSGINVDKREGYDDSRLECEGNFCPADVTQNKRKA
jgi:adenosylcobalamin-dependent ribonucleoside-triphosphate reductase